MKRSPTAPAKSHPPRAGHSKTVSREQPASKSWIVAAAMILVAAVWPWFKLHLPLWYDEAYTIYFYASHPASYIATHYEAPNNHVAFSILLHAWSFLIHDPMMVRLDPAALRLLPIGLWALGIGAFFVAARRLVSSDLLMAAAATLLLTGLPRALEFSHQLRGYGPSIVWFCAILAILTHAHRLPRVLYAALLAGGFFLVNYTVPSNAWFTLPLALSAFAWSLAWAAGALEESTGGDGFPSRAQAAANLRRRWPLVAWTIGALAAGFALTYLAYRPLMAQMNQYAHTPRGVVAMVHSLWTGWRPHWSRLLEAVGLVPSHVVTLVLLLAGLGVLVGRARRSAFARRSLIVAGPVFLLSPVVAAALTPPGFVRNDVVFAPFATVLYAWAIMGVADGVQRLRPSFSRRGAVRAAAGGMALLACVHGIHYAVAYQRAFHPDRTVAAFQAQRSADSLLIYGWDSDSYAMRYYAQVYGVADRAIYFKNCPTDLRNRVREIWIASGSPEDLKSVQSRLGLTGSSALVGSFGRQELYRWAAQ